MKVVKKTLIAGVLTCAALNAQAADADAIPYSNAQTGVCPFSYGIKAGVSISSLHSFGEAKLGGKAAQNSFFDNFFATGALYGEYAFTDYIGIGLEAGYMQQGGSLHGEEAQNANANATTPSAPSVEMTTHGIVVPLSVYCYPMGREVDEGILKIGLGASGYLPIGDPKLKNMGKELPLKGLSDTQKKEFPGLDVAAHVSLGYELTCGVSFEARYGFGFLNRFGGKDSGKDQTILQNCKDLKEMKSHYVTAGLGYNIASLFSE